ncbi:MAG: serine O-acetyltransferase EpsC [Planctomycetota bacterium]|jgi:serine O-acetyltransferase
MNSDEANLREQLPGLVKKIVESYDRTDTIRHVVGAALPDRDAIIKILNNCFTIVYPGYFGEKSVDGVNLEYFIGLQVDHLARLLCEQVSRSIEHERTRLELLAPLCRGRGEEVALEFVSRLPGVREKLALDVQAHYDGDPAAKTLDEIIFSYPGMYAITVYRIAHELHEIGAPLIPRIMTEHAHSVTGIDIHPGATIGKSFFIDHGTGVVIGETTIIGDRVRMYHGVTLGALSPRKGQQLRGKKRHPTIEDDVTIYPGATILGGETIIGKGSIVGGNVWLTHSVDPGTRVAIEEPHLRFRNKAKPRGKAGSKSSRRKKKS